MPDPVRRGRWIEAGYGSEQRSDEVVALLGKPELVDFGAD